jgi:class 3 adenylate cyclase
VVKRIGDELMVTFKDLAGAECFVDSPVTDTVLQTYQYKIAVDFGSAYHFRFVEHLADDPYGPVVDRCARIAKYAGPSTVICSRAYRNRVANPAAYVSMGNFALRSWAVDSRCSSKGRRQRWCGSPRSAGEESPGRANSPLPESRRQRFAEAVSIPTEVLSRR